MKNGLTMVKKPDSDSDSNVVNKSTDESKTEKDNSLEIENARKRKESAPRLLKQVKYARWSMELRNGLTIPKLIEDDIVKQQFSFDGPRAQRISRVGFTQSAWEEFQWYVDVPLEQWLTEEFLGSRHLRFLEPVQRYPPPEQPDLRFYEYHLVGKENMVLFAVYRDQDDVVLHVLGFYSI